MKRYDNGILIYLNSSPISWFSEAQNTVDSSTFGSEFIVLCICVEMIEALRYKLCILGIPIEEPANVFCDNKSVVTNSTVPTSTLKKKHNSITCHRVREAVASGKVRTVKVKTEENLADILTALNYVQEFKRFYGSKPTTCSVRFEGTEEILPYAQR